MSVKTFERLILASALVSSLAFFSASVTAAATVKTSPPAKAAAGKTAPAPVVLSEEEQTITLINKALPSVVSIVGSQKNADGTKQVVLRGTGFIADASGVVLTNRHVVEQADLTYTAYLTDGRRFTATVASRDPLNDLAILKIPNQRFSVLPLGDSDKLRIGQTAIVIGNSLGRYNNTVTRGIISGIGRSLTAGDSQTGKSENLDDVIQTDAAINPGNSGGPLLNSRGEVVGISTAIDQEGRGVGFAIPINLARRALDTYRQDGRIIRPYLGVRYQTITVDIQDERNLSYDYGALITPGQNPGEPAVVPGSPADRSGLKDGDIILAVDGQLVRATQTLLRLIQAHKPGDTLTLTVARHGTVVTVLVTLVELPANNGR